MSYQFGQEWREISWDSFGAAPSFRIQVRTADSLPELIDVTAYEEVISIGSITRRRDRKFGVIQGQAWQAKLTNSTLLLTGRKMAGGYAQLEIGLSRYEDDVRVWYWEKLAVGKIASVTGNADGSVLLDVEDVLVGLVNSKLPRTVFFGDKSWASEITVSDKGDDSESYDADIAGAGIEIDPALAGYVIDQKYTIEFQTPTTFIVRREDDSTRGTGSISADYAFPPTGKDPAAIIIKKEGWNTDAQAYLPGDKFQFYTSRARTTAELHGFGMIRHLIEDVAGVTTFDLETGNETSPIYDESNWAALAALSSEDEFGGRWEVGSVLIDMIQGINRILHSSLYVMPNGTIGAWMLSPGASTGLSLNGDSDFGPVTITSATLQKSILETYNRAMVSYKTLGGDDVTIEKKNQFSEYDDDLVYSTSTQWRIRRLSVDACLDRLLSRFGGESVTVQMDTTFGGAIVALGDLAAVNEPGLGLFSAPFSIVESSIDPSGAAVRVVGVTESILALEYATIGTAKIDTEGVVW